MGEGPRQEVRPGPAVRCASGDIDSQGISILPVRTAADRRAFRLLPFRLYSRDPYWVPPLHRDIKAFLDVRRHPFSGSGSIEYFLARREGLVAGRIAAIENRAHNTHHRDLTGFFGFFETENDPQVAARLLDAAETWVRARGLASLRGPCSPSTNYECGLLVAGEPGPPTLMMPYNPSWYAGLIEAQGFRKVRDLYAFRQDKESSELDRWARLAEKIRARAGVSLRRLDLKSFGREVQAIVEIYHDAWSENWGFVPLNSAEVERMARELRPVIVPWLGAFVMKDGQEVAFYLGLPDYNRVLRHLRGRLFPFGFLRLLRSKNRLDFMRLLLMGVRKEYHHLGLDVLLYDDVVRTCLSRGITSNESSWILEDNLPMINTLERAGARRWRTYRIYEKALEDPS
jgi:GNAT superfamily N-acetyltransferase